MCGLSLEVEKMSQKKTVVNQLHDWLQEVTRNQNKFKLRVLSPTSYIYTKQNMANVTLLGAQGE